MHTFPLRLAALAMAVGLIGAACGDEKSGLTKADWIKAAAAICVEGSAEFNTLFETDFPTTPESTQDFLGKAAPIIEGEVEALEALGTPDEDGEAVEAAIASGKKAVADLENGAASPEAAAEIFDDEGGDDLNAYEAGMTELGVPECDPEDSEEEAEEEAEEDRPDPSTFSPEKAAYVEAADAVCAQTEDGLRFGEDALLADFPPPLENWAKFFAGAIPVLERHLTQMEALEPPAEDAGTIDELLASQRDLMDEVRKAQEAAAAGDQETFDEVSAALFTSFDQVDLQLRAYGFQVCGAEDEDPPEAGDDDSDEDGADRSDSGSDPGGDGTDETEE